MNPAHIRRDILALTYQQRESDPDRGWVNRADLIAAIGACDFALSVLTEIGHLKKDGYHYRITGAGVLAYEAMRDPAP